MSNPVKRTVDPPEQGSFERDSSRTGSDFAMSPNTNDAKDETANLKAKAMLSTTAPLMDASCTSLTHESVTSAPLMESLPILSPDYKDQMRRHVEDRTVVLAHHGVPTEAWEDSNPPTESPTTTHSRLRVATFVRDSTLDTIGISLQRMLVSTGVHRLVITNLHPQGCIAQQTYLQVGQYIRKINNVDCTYTTTQDAIQLLLVTQTYVTILAEDVSSHSVRNDAILVSYDDSMVSGIMVATPHVPLGLSLVSHGGALYLGPVTGALAEHTDLVEGDRLVAMDHASCRGMSARDALALVHQRQNGTVVTLVVTPTPVACTVKRDLTMPLGLGLRSIQNRLYVSSIAGTGAVATQTELLVGDELLSIDDVDCGTLSTKEAAQLLRCASVQSTGVTLVVNASAQRVNRRIHAAQHVAAERLAQHRADEKEVRRACCWLLTIVLMLISIIIEVVTGTVLGIDVSSDSGCDLSGYNSGYSGYNSGYSGYNSGGGSSNSSKSGQSGALVSMVFSLLLVIVIACCTGGLQVSHLDRWIDGQTGKSKPVSNKPRPTSAPTTTATPAQLTANDDFAGLDLAVEMFELAVDV